MNRDGWYVVADEIPPLMRQWLTGKRFSAPFGVHFECSEQLAATLKIEQPSPAEEWSPYTLGVVGSLADQTGLPIITRPDLHGGQWQLTAPLADSVMGAMPSVTRVVIREGAGKPTALERSYWLVDLEVVLLVDPSYTYLADAEARRQLLRYAAALGHDCDEKDIKLTRRPGAKSWERWVYRADVAAPREPVRYPVECHDWLCEIESHWADADPADEPAVFAGAVAEKRYADRLLSDQAVRWIPGFADMFQAHMASRRSRAAGQPLWTIDVRPKR